jgi:small redox-active disulfide protein 2
MEIKILGAGCPNCKRLERVTHDALDELGIQAKITKVTDMTEILAYNIMATPGLVIDEKVVSYGRVPSKAEVASMLATAQSATESFG